MIISHDYNYIFIKTNKTAGTSIEIALSMFCGPIDIITPLLPKDEEFRRALGYRGAQNYLSPFSDYTFRDWIQWFLKGKRKKRFYNHISAKEIRRYIDQRIWESYYKFCFVRNPWDRFLSFYWWRCRSEPMPTITEFLASDIPLVLKRRGYDLYTINGQVVVDRICRYENFDEEIEAVCRRLGIPEKIELPRTKSGYRKDKRPYRDILTEEEQAAITDLFNDEINLLGHEF